MKLIEADSTLGFIVFAGGAILLFLLSTAFLKSVFIGQASAQFMLFLWQVKSGVTKFSWRLLFLKVTVFQYLVIFDALMGFGYEVFNREGKSIV